MNMNFSLTNLASRYNLMSQLFGVKKNQNNGGVENEHQQNRTEL